MSKLEICVEALKTIRDTTIEASTRKRAITALIAIAPKKRGPKGPHVPKTLRTAVSLALQDGVPVRKIAAAAELAPGTVQSIKNKMACSYCQGHRKIYVSDNTTSAGGYIRCVYCT